MEKGYDTKQGGSMRRRILPSGRALTTLLIVTFALPFVPPDSSIADISLPYTFLLALYVYIYILPNVFLSDIEKVCILNYVSLKSIIVS